MGGSRGSRLSEVVMSVGENRKPEPKEMKVEER